MSLSLNVYAFQPPDEEWQKMKAVYDACRAAEIDPPEEVEEYFGGEAPDPAGQTVDLHDKIRDFRSQYAWGYEIDVADIPPYVKVLRWTVD